MKENAHIKLVGQRTVLVPFHKLYVPKYHAWMADPWIQEMTCSEPLSLEKEYEGQRSWNEDPMKLTFIILSADHAGSEACSPSSAVGDVNLVLATDEPHVAELMVMVAEEGSRRKVIFIAERGAFFLT